MKHEHLSITIWTSANANGWDGNFICDLFGEISWNTFDYNSKGTRLFYRVCIFE
jgi:hypothetical protein